MFSKKSLLRILGTSFGVITCLGALASCGDKDESTSTTSEPIVTTEPDEIKEISIQEALNICKDLTATTEERYYIRGTVESIDNAQYGQMTISDSTGEIEVYGTYSSDGTKRYSELEDKPVKGDTVLLYATLQNFNGKYEIHSGWIIEFTHPDSPSVDISLYTSMDILHAREASKDTLVKTKGVVAQITYANGKIPSGFYLVDSTASIYVYDSQIAPQVSVGNEIEICATKTYYVLSTEETYAQKYEYKGSCQLSNVTLLSNDKKTTDFDKSWIETKTVKDILDNDFDEDITNVIYKTDAIINKVINPGFVNYYINDLDNETGTYVYTQCNGADFDWLDSFDGEICTVYFTVINAKATDTGCNWRVVPILVSNDNYTFDETNTCDFVYEYFVDDKILDEYKGDPVLSLTNSLNLSHLNLEDITITYSSSNIDVIYFESTENEFFMHANKTGEATVSITVSYKTYSKTFTKTISVEEVSSIVTISISDAYKAEMNTEVTIRGIVAGGIANQSGFYLVDSTGVIAIKMDKENFEGLQIGQEIIIKGTRTDTNGKNQGQSHLKDAEILANLGGNHSYSSESFITDKTVSDILALEKVYTSTESAYIITAKVEFVTSQYATTLNLVDGESSLSIYCGNAATQYAWLKDYDGKIVTLEVGVCNWNGKAIKGSIISVINEDGTKVSSTLPTSN